MDAAELTAQFERLEGNVSAALSAVASKGVAAPSGSTSDNLASLIASIIVLDLSVVTVTPETLAEGVTAYDASGNLITGTAQIVTGPAYTNLLPAALDYNGNVFNEIGYIDGYYLTGNANANAATGYSFISTDSTHFTTGFIPYTKAQYQAGTPIYVKGITLDTTQSHTRMGAYPNYTHSTYLDPIKFSAGSGYLNAEKLSDGYYKITLGSGVASTYSDWSYIRFSFTGSGAGVVITVGEEITD